jgi:hypothetical protein
MSETSDVSAAGKSAPKSSYRSMYMPTIESVNVPVESVNVPVKSMAVESVTAESVAKTETERVCRPSSPTPIGVCIAAIRIIRISIGVFVSVSVTVDV